MSLYTKRGTGGRRSRLGWVVAHATHHDVDAEHPDHALDGPPLEERVVDRALERVAGVEEQRAVDGTGVGAAAFPVDGRLEPSETTVTRPVGSDALAD